jgi:ubiquitin-conjugating enzyme E2 J1
MENTFLKPFFLKFFLEIFIGLMDFLNCLLLLLVFFWQPNGRFETQTKICLSISNHHPEHWQPSWSGTFLIVIVGFTKLLCV